jgi:hypothetical protein
MLKIAQKKKKMSGGLFNFINHLKKEKKVEQIS